MEPIVVPRQITGSDLQQVVTQRDLRCTTSDFKPAKTKREVNVPSRFGKYFTHGSFRSEESEPLTYKQAVDSTSSEKWIEAMNEELYSLKENETWSLVKPPKGRKIVPGKWVFKIKRNEHGAVEKYKARFVAKGFAQIEGLDYGETFAPTSRPETFRFVLALAAQHDLHLEELDVE